MKIKKLLIHILLSILSAILLCNFDYDSYEPKTLDELNNQIDEKGDIEPGVTFFKQKYKIKINISEYPEEISKRNISKLKYFANITGYYQTYGNEFIQAFGYELEYVHNNKNHVLLFQSVLIEYLKDEADIGDDVELFIIFGSHNDFDNKIMVLVNEFKVLKKE